MVNTRHTPSELYTFPVHGRETVANLRRPVFISFSFLSFIVLLSVLTRLSIDTGKFCLWMRMVRFSLPIYFACSNPFYLLVGSYSNASSTEEKLDWQSPQAKLINSSSHVVSWAFIIDPRRIKASHHIGSDRSKRFFSPCFWTFEQKKQSRH